MKKLLISTAITTLLTTSVAFVHAQELQLVNQNNISILDRCKQVGGTLVKRDKKSSCVVESKALCQRIGGKVVGLGKAESCVVNLSPKGDGHNPAGGIEGTDIGSGAMKSK